MAFIDSHCHLNDESFDNDRDQVLQNMVDVGIKKAMIISNYLPDFEKGLKIKKEGITFKHSLGIFPTDAKDVDEKMLADYEKLMAGDKCDAIGEIGLDYHWDSENKEKQKEVFIAQLKIAQRLNKPVIIHSRDAIQDTYDILKANPVKGVLHCYSNSKEMAKELLKLGLYISISGTVTFKNAREPLEVIKVVPKDRLLIETDCPYLAPTPFRGKRNEPAYVTYTGNKIMEELGIEKEAFLKQIEENYDNLFKGV